MDPTIQRIQSPFKRALDACVFCSATYLLPSAAALGLGFTFLANGTALAPVIAPLVAAVWFWAIAYESVTAYRGMILVPREYDLSLDPPSANYAEFFLSRFLTVAALLLLALIGIRQHQLIAAVITLASGGLIWLMVALRQTVDEHVHGRPHIESGSIGSRLRPARFVRDLVQRENGFEPTGMNIWWGGVELAINTLIHNFLVIGSVGSGKTLILKKWLQCTLPLVDRYSRARALIVDPKWELYPFLLALVLSYKIKLLHPGDSRACAWAISTDLTNHKHIHEASYGFIPADDKESQPFFTDGARRLLYGTMLALNLRAPGRWWFSDVFYALQDLRLLTAILNLHPETRAILRTYAKNDRVLADVFATLDSKLGEFMPVAATWSHLQRNEPHKTVSLTDWTNGNFVLVVGKLASETAAQSKLIQLLLKRASQLLLDGPTGQSTLPLEEARRTIIAIDEAPRAGKLDILDLVTNGRDYGIGVIAVTQSVEAMRQYYSKHGELEALANEFHSQAFLSVNGSSTATWMSDRLGKILSGKHWKATLDETQFQTLSRGKTVGPDCIPGVYLNSKLGAWYSEDGVDLIEPVSHVPCLAPAPDLPLRRWDDEDLQRLGLLHLRDQLRLDDDGAGPTSGPKPTRPRQPGSGRPIDITRFRP